MQISKGGKIQRSERNAGGVVSKGGVGRTPKKLRVFWVLEGLKTKARVLEVLK